MNTISSVLVVEDNLPLAQFIKILLEKWGKVVTLANDGVEGADWLKQRKFDAVITDLDMPRRTGLEVLADLRRLHPGTRAIVMSGDWVVEGTDCRSLASSLGIRACLTKPFTMYQLRDFLEGELSRPDGAPPRLMRAS